MRRITAFLAAAGMAVAPVAATAQDASALSLAGASGPMSSGLSFLQDEEGGGGSTAVALGVLLIVLIGAAAISGNGDHPHSP
jgi:hypothetical protein